MKTTYDLFCEIKSLNTGISDDRIWYELDTAIEDDLKVSPEDSPPVAEEILTEELYRGKRRKRNTERNVKRVGRKRSRKIGKRNGNGGR